MSWNDHHSRSEKLAVEAEMATRAGDGKRAIELYVQAATEELAAFEFLSGDKSRTRGITAVSVVSLFFKGQDYGSAERLAQDYLRSQLPKFAEIQLGDLLDRIRLNEGQLTVREEDREVGRTGRPIHIPYEFGNARSSPMEMCGRCYDEVDKLFPANCTEKPEAVSGPIGMYHCPDCGGMVMAGMEHPKLCQRCVDRKHPSFDKEV